MRRFFFYFLAFMLFSVLVFNVYGVKMKVLPFMEFKDGKYIHNKEQLSIGVSYSVGGLLRGLPGYEVDYEYSDVNYELGNLESAIRNNQGYDMYMWVVYRKKEGIVSYDVRGYDSSKKEVFSFKVDGDYNNPDDIFNVVDNIVIGVAKRLVGVSGDVGFGGVRFSFEGVGNKVYKVFLNGREVLSVTNDMVRYFRLFSGIDYWVTITRFDERGNKKDVYSGIIKLDRDEAKDIVYRSVGEVVVKGREKGYLVVLDGNLISLPYDNKVLGNSFHNLEVYKDNKLIFSNTFYVEDEGVVKLFPFKDMYRKFFNVRVGSGSSGMLGVSGEWFLNTNFSLCASSGVSFLNIGGDNVFVISLQGVSRYYVFEYEDILRGNVFLGLGGNIMYYDVFLLFSRVVSVFGGVGIDAWGVYLDIGGGIGYNVVLNDIAFGPYVGLGFKF